MNRKLIKYLCICLSMILLLTSVYLPVIASEGDALIIEDAQDIIADETAVPEGTVEESETESGTEGFLLEIEEVDTAEVEAMFAGAEELQTEFTQWESGELSDDIPTEYLMDLDGDGEADFFAETKEYVKDPYSGTLRLKEARYGAEADINVAAEGEVTVHSSISSAAADIRAQWKARIPAISLGIAPESYYYGMGTDLYYIASEHTGVPDEGDYLQHENGGCTITTSSVRGDNGWEYVLTYEIHYYTDAAQQAQVTEKLASVMPSLGLSGKSEYEKAKAIYDYICGNVVYDYVHLGDENYKLQYTAYAALLDGTAVCNGYATLFYRMALEAGLNCRYVFGYTDDGGCHAWNIVEIDGRYYNLDATWDSVYTQYRWFLKSMETFVDHNRDVSYSKENFNSKYPMASSDYNPNQTQEQVTSGNCGSGLVWAVNDSNVLFIAGNGAMENYTDANPAPWTGLEVTSVILSSGVTSVGDQAFCYNEQLASVSLPSGIVSIGKQAFAGCTALKSLSVPDTVTVIGEQAFAYAGLESLALPEGLQSIGYRACYFCDSLQQVTCPVLAAEAGSCLFDGCTSLVKLNLTGSGAMPDYVQYTDSPWYCRSLQEVTFQRGITRIGAYTFCYCPAIKEIKLPDTVTEVGEYAFYGCVAATKLTIPVAAADAPRSAFAGNDNLTHLVLTGKGAMPDYTDTVGAPWGNILKKAEIGSGITTIGTRAFYNCTQLSSLTIPNTVKKIGERAFLYCSSLKTITLPSALTTIGERAFFGCTGFTAISLPAKVTTIDAHAFYGCTNVTKLTMPIAAADAPRGSFGNCPNLTHLVLNGNGAMPNYAECYETPWEGTLKKVEIGSGITRVGSYAFYNCNKITSVKIPETVTKIGTYGFAFCTSLKSIAIPETVTSIKTRAFVGCNSLTIKALTGSKAYSYAKDNGISFKSTGVVAPVFKSIENTRSGVKLTWNKTTGAKGYRIYRKTTGSWKKIADITSGSTVTYTDKTAKSGTNYSYQIRVRNSGELVSAYSKKSVSIRYLAAPSFTTAKNVSGQKISLAWKQVSGATGFDIRYVTGSTTKTVTVKYTTLKKTLSSLKKNKTYKVYIRTRYKSGGKVEYSAWSAAKSIKVTK